MLLIRNLTFLKDETMVEIVQLIDGAILTKFDGVKRQLEVQISKGQPCRHLLDFFFYQVIFSQTLTIHRAAGKGRGSSFIPLYHFHPLTNIETFICNFACEMTITYF